MKTTQRIIGIALIAILTIGTAMPSFAQSNKDETVYIQLDASGRLKKATVVNAFEHVKGEIVDYGRYENIVNLSTDNVATQEGDAVLFNVLGDAKDTFYYQGDIINAVNPWVIDIAYKLDGKAISADKLGNASGALEIEMHVKRNPLSEVAFADTYTLQLTVTLNDDVASNIDVSGASVITIGSNKQIAMTVLPKQEKTAMIKADIQKFKMDSITATGTLADLDLDFDTQSMNAGIDDLSSGSESLKDGMTQFGTGLDKTADAVTTLNAHLSELAAGGNKLLEGTSQFDLGLDNLDSSGAALTSGLQALKDQHVQASTSNEAIAQLATQLLQNPDPSVQKLAQAALGQIQLSSGTIDALDTLGTGLEQFTQGVSELNQSKAALTEGMKNYVAGAAGISQAFKKFSGSFKALPNQYTLLMNGQSEIDNGIESAKTTLASTMAALPFSTTAEDTSIASFTSEKNTPKSVQFVMKTPSVDFEIVQDIIPEKIVKKTFIERVLELFR